MTRKASHFFVAGGTLPPDSPSYVKRSADDELLQYVLDGTFCYVLTPRQMGKSSLMIHTAQELKTQAVRTAIIDLTQIGTVTAEQWVLGLLIQLKRRLRLREEPVAWWQAKAPMSYIQRFTTFLRDVILTELTEQVVIFIDEIDTTLNLDFRDDFFAAIRAIYNARADEPEFKRLTFVLLGVSTPAELIQDTRRTPFNIGQAIRLEEFSLTEATVLEKGLEALYPAQGAAILARLYHWTSGHPYLTQYLCLTIVRSDQKDWNRLQIDSLVDKLFFSPSASKETNLQFVQHKILTSPHKRDLLALYQKVYQGQKVADERHSPLHEQLKLSGLVKAEKGYLHSRNRIYQQVFDLKWLRKHREDNWMQRLSRVLRFFRH
jgi:hypothetical protein